MPQAFQRGETIQQYLRNETAGSTIKLVRDIRAPEPGSPRLATSRSFFETPMTLKEISALIAQSSQLAAKGPRGFIVDEPNLYFKLTTPGQRGVHSIGIARHGTDLYAVNCYGMQATGAELAPLVSYAFGVAEENLVAVVAALVS